MNEHYGTAVVTYCLPYFYELRVSGLEPMHSSEWTVR